MAEMEPRNNWEAPVAYRDRLRAALRRRVALRQAIVLAEILAPPVALRTSRAWPSAVQRLSPIPKSSR